MSKLRAQIQLDDSVRSAEFDRKAFGYNVLKQQVQHSFPKAASMGLRIVTPKGDYIEVNSDQSLQRALTEALTGNARYLDVRIAGSYVAPSPASSAPSTPVKSEPTPVSYSNPSTPVAASTSSPAPSSGSSSVPRSFTRPTSGTYSATSTPTKTASSPSSAPSSASKSSTPHKGEYHVITWNIRGDKGSSLDKVKVNHSATFDSFTFTMQPSKYDTEVRVVLADPRKLSFECTYSFEDVTLGGQRGVRTVTVTQSVGLPYVVTPDHIEATHEHVVVRAPHDTL